jgi:PKD repeat protein
MSSTKITETNITPTGVTPGYYTAANITVNAEGQVLAATHGNTITVPLSHFNYTIFGKLIKSVGRKRWYAPSTLTIIEIRGYLVKPANALTKFGVRKNGTLAKEVNFLANATYTNSSSTSEIAMVQGDYLTVDLLQTGTGAEDLYIQFIYSN